MRRTLSKLLTVAIACALLLTCFACNQTTDARTKLIVWNFDGGYGNEWLYEAERLYEANHPDVNIEVLPTNAKNGLSGTQIKNSKANVFFSEGASYTAYIGENVLEDITDILTTENPYDNKKIIDKFTEQQKDYYKNSDGKYYGIPHYAGYNGFVYNIKLFNDNNFYFKKDKPTAANPRLEDYFISNATEEKSYGPNGKTGVVDGVDYSYDDGLPSTYEEFLILLKYMNQAGLGEKFKPISITGKYREQYLGLLYNALVADYEGDEMLLNYTFNGEATDLGRVEGGVFVKDENATQITPENGYELARQAGKYYALEFLSEIFSNGDNFNETYITKSDENTTAQLRFIRGESAMLAEGVFWEAESHYAGNFSEIDKNKHDFEFGWMPLPKADESKIGTETIIDNIYSLCFVRKGISEQEKAMAKDFIQFVYSDDMLSKFTGETGTVRSLNYTVKNEDLNKLTSFGKSVYSQKQAATLLLPLGNNDLFRKNQSEFTGRQYYKTKYNNYANISAMILPDNMQNRPAPDAGAYFNGISEYYNETYWNNLQK